jgi:hypothetical protein
MGSSEARGTLIYEKNLKSKISRQALFKLPLKVTVAWYGFFHYSAPIYDRKL